VNVLSGLDAAFLHLETPETPMHVGSLHLYDPPPRRAGDLYAWFRRHVAARMQLSPLARRRLAPAPLQFANPVWIDDDQLDLDYHVERVVLPRPGTQPQLESCVARLHSIPLERTRPLWKFYLVDGLKSGQFAVYMKIHHAVVDGASGVALVKSLLDPTPAPRRLRRPMRADAGGGPQPPLHVLLAAALEHDADQYGKLLGSLPDMLRSLAGMFRSSGDAAAVPAALASLFAPRTPLNGTITRARGFATASLPLGAVKAIAAHHGATVNDVVLALCAGALRQYLAGRGALPEKPLLALMAVSLREPGDTDASTQVTLTRVGLATDIADPVARLAAIHAAAGGIKSAVRQHKSRIPTDFPSLGMPWLVSALAGAYGRSKLADAMPPIANVVISNVPGPPAPLYLAGARMRTCWPVSIVEHGVGPNMTVVSYCDALDFGITVARNRMPDVRKLAAALHDALEELRRASPAATARRMAPGKQRR